MKSMNKGQVAHRKRPAAVNLSSFAAKKLMHLCTSFKWTDASDEECALVAPHTPISRTMALVKAVTII